MGNLIDIKTITSARARKQLVDIIKPPKRVPMRRADAVSRKEYNELKDAVKELIREQDVTDTALDELIHRTETLERTLHTLLRHVTYLVNRLKENGINL